MGNKELCPPDFIPPTRDALIAGIWKASGTAPTSRNSRTITDMLARVADAAMSVVDPRSLLKQTEITGVEESVLTGREVSIACRELCRLMASMDQPDSIFGFALTLGGELDALIVQTQRKSLAGALFLDAAGSFLAEQYAAQVEDHLRVALALQGLELSARFSPGYSDWDIACGQPELFRFLLPQTIGISLWPSGMMSPFKSITGICIAAAHVPPRTPCESCHKQDCRYRRVVI